MAPESLLSNTITLIAAVLFINTIACSQISDSTHPTVHQTQSSLHRWDDLKIDSGFGEFLSGREYAREGKLPSAEREFKKGLNHNKCFAYFDLGIVASVQARYRLALSCFRNSYKTEKDSTCLNEIENMKRIIGEHKAFHNTKRGPG